MLRVGGTMVYESDAFYALCDELGILIWQDFMFANMDYPVGDADFLASVRSELLQEVGRLARHPSVACYCGNSEVEQQAAMFGQTADAWRSELFYDVAPEIVAAGAPGTPYVPASPSGGALPFHSDAGVAHYFGVGAYRRPLHDVDNNRVLFASECLGFSNLPSPEAISARFGSLTPAPHSPAWKAGVPRDSAASWDFEDVRDTYLEYLYGVAAGALRQTDPARWFDLSTVVSGEVMQSVFERWMHPDNACNGGLIWFLMDLVPGAGWGMLDVDGQPKPLYYFLRRAFSSQGVAWRDRGLEGLTADIRSGADEPLRGALRVQILQHAHTLIREFSKDIELSAGGRQAVAIDRELGQFFDTTYSYCFGPPKHDVVVATLLGADDRVIQTAAYFPNDRNLAPLNDATVDITCATDGDQASITITSDAFLQCVHLKARHFAFDDDYFHVAPQTPVTVTARRTGGGDRALSGTLTALNLDSGLRFS